MEKSVKIWLFLLATLGILLTYSYLISDNPIHFSCQTSGQRDDLYTYQTNFDSLFNRYQVRTMALVLHENGSLTLDGFEKETIKPDCRRW